MNKEILLTQLICLNKNKKITVDIVMDKLDCTYEQAINIILSVANILCNYVNFNLLRECGDVYIQYTGESK